MAVEVVDVLPELDLALTISASGSRTLSASAKGLLVFGAAEDTSTPKTAFTAVNWNSVGLAEVPPAGGNLATGNVRSQIFHLNLPATGAQTLDATVDNAANKGAQIVGISINDSIVGLVSDPASGSGTALSGLEAAGTVGGLALAIIVFQGGPGTINPAAGETVRAQVGSGDATYAVITKAAGETTTFATTWTDAQNWSALMVTLQPSVTGPLAPSFLALAEGSDDQVTALEWVNGETYDSVKVHRSTTQGFTPGAGSTIETVTGSPAFRADATAPPDTQLYYVIEGITAAGSAFSPELAVYTPPLRPTGTTATPGPGKVTIDGATLPTAGSDFEVWRDGVPMALLDLADLPWEDDAVVAGTEYSYRFRALKNGRASGFTDPVLATPQTLVLPPAEPSNVVAVALSPTDVRITWQDNSANEDGFRVFRDGIQVHETAADVVEWTDSGRTPDTEYTYLVRSFNAAGPSGDSNAYVVRTPAVVAESAFVPQAILF